MGSYDQMQVCLNGHQITSNARQYPQHRSNFCKKCGSKTIDSCPSCGVSIKGEYTEHGVFFISDAIPVPDYCENCGTAFPWLLSAIENLSDVLRESDVSGQDIAEIEATLSDVLRETPKTEGAALKLKRLLGRLSKPSYEIAIKVVSDLASETAKKTMGL